MLGSKSMTLDQWLDEENLNCLFTSNEPRNLCEATEAICGLDCIWFEGEIDNEDTWTVDILKDGTAITWCVNR